MSHETLSNFSKRRRRTFIMRFTTKSTYWTFLLMTKTIKICQDQIFYVRVKKVKQLSPNSINEFLYFSLVSTLSFYSFLLSLPLWCCRLLFGDFRLFRDQFFVGRFNFIWLGMLNIGHIIVIFTFSWLWKLRFGISYQYQ